LIFGPLHSVPHGPYLVLLSQGFQCVVNQDRLHGKVLAVPDYALDKHTIRGRSLGRGVQHWREEGCVLAPESEVEDSYEDHAYEYWEDGFIDTHYGKRGQGRKQKATSAQASLF
jgi:hypothetical protein